MRQILICGMRPICLRAFIGAHSWLRGTEVAKTSGQVFCQCLELKNIYIYVYGIYMAYVANAHILSV